MTDLAPSIITRIMREIRDLNREPTLPGISYVEQDDMNSLSEIHAIITGPEETPYAGGKFRMKLILSGEYPSVPPKGVFLTRIFHPNIAPTGEICVNTLKKDWSPDVTIKNILQVIRCLLINPFPESSLNDEAGKLFMDSYEEFAHRARLMRDIHAMETSKENPDVFDSAPRHGIVTASIATFQSDSEPSKVESVTVDETENKKKRIKEATKKSLKRL